MTAKLTMYITKPCWLVKFVHIISKQMVSMNNNYNIFYDLTSNSLFATEALEQMGRRLFRDGFPVVNMAALANEEFKVAGEIMASSVVQGGPAPSFLSTSSFAYIVHGVSSIKADDANDIVEDACLKEAIQKVYSCILYAWLSNVLYPIS